MLGCYACLPISPRWVKEKRFGIKLFYALKRAGKEVTYVELKEGTHHLDNLFDRKTTFEAIDQFLNQHLPL
jgi:dipeptidyl aminopeptidase/acylaminoacyl peptidase